MSKYARRRASSSGSHTSRHSAHCGQPAPTARQESLIRWGTFRGASVAHSARNYLHISYFGLSVAEQPCHSLSRRMCPVRAGAKCPAQYTQRSGVQVKMIRRRVRASAQLTDLAAKYQVDRKTLPVASTRLSAVRLSPRVAPPPTAPTTSKAPSPPQGRQPQASERSSRRRLASSGKSAAVRLPPTSSPTLGHRARRSHRPPTSNSAVCPSSPTLPPGWPSDSPTTRLASSTTCRTRCSTTTTRGAASSRRQSAGLANNSPAAAARARGGDQPPPRGAPPILSPRLRRSRQKSDMRRAKARMTLSSRARNGVWPLRRTRAAFGAMPRPHPKVETSSDAGRTANRASTPNPRRNVVTTRALLSPFRQNATACYARAKHD